jgi:formylglycine-generating enzyme required for sulfatase activity
MGSWLGLLLVASAVEAAEEPSPGRSYAVVVGVNRPNETQFKALEFAEADASELGAALTLLDYEVHILAGESVFAGRKQQVTADDIVRALESVARRIKETDRLVVLLSGQGVQLAADKPDKSGQRDVYFCPGAADLSNRATLVPLSRVLTIMAGCAARQRLLVVDCFREKLPRPIGRVKLIHPPTPQTAAHLASAIPDGMVAHFVCGAGGLEDKELRHGVYLHFLTQYVNGQADEYKDEQLNLPALASFASARTKARVPAGKYAANSPALVWPTPYAADERGNWSLGRSPVSMNSIGMKLRRIPAGEFQMGYRIDAWPKSWRADPFYRLTARGYDPLNGPALNGAEQWEKGYGPDSLPRIGWPHRVRITKPFYLGQYEVTQQQYQKVMGDNPSKFGADSPNQPSPDQRKRFSANDLPADGVSWNDAVLFCQRLSEQEKRRYRLPTEAEWEYACKAGTSSLYHFGRDLNGSQANCDGREPFPHSGSGGSIEQPAPPKGPYLGRPAAVGSYRPNAFGLYDMHGNVSEWCSDYFDGMYYKDSPVDDPPGPSKSNTSRDPKREDGQVGEHHVIRGGCWALPARFCLSISRDYGPEIAHFSGQARSKSEKSGRTRYGFRVVLEADSVTKSSPSVSRSNDANAEKK